MKHDHPVKAQIFQLDELECRPEAVESCVCEGKLEFALHGNYNTRMFEIIIQ